MKLVNYKFIMPFFLPAIQTAPKWLYALFFISGIGMIVGYIFNLKPWGIIFLFLYPCLMLMIWLMERKPLQPLDYLLKRYVQFDGKIEIVEQSQAITLYHIALSTAENLHIINTQTWYLILGRHQGFSIFYQKFWGNNKEVLSEYTTKNPPLKKILAPLAQLKLRAFAHSPILIDIGIQAISDQNEPLILFFQHLEYTDANNVSHVLRYQHLKQRHASFNRHSNTYHIELGFKTKNFQFQLTAEEMEFLRYVLSENDQYLIG